MEIGAIRIDITIGDLEVVRAPSWWVESLRGYPLSRAGITLPDPDGELSQAIKIGDAIDFEFGYRDQAGATWSGTVALVQPGETRDQLEIRAVDAALPLTTTKIVQAWADETPEAIVSWIIRRAGLTPGTITPTGIVIPRFVAGNKPAWQLVQQLTETCQRGFGVDMSQWALWLGADGINWGDMDEPGSTPVIATGEGLIDHQPADGDAALSMIETWLLADLTHSRQVRLEDARRAIGSTFRAQRVRHEGTPDRARTFIWY